MSAAIIPGPWENHRVSRGELDDLARRLRAELDRFDHLVVDFNEGMRTHLKSAARLHDLHLDLVKAQMRARALLVDTVLRDEDWRAPTRDPV